ncbi:hypothetical protein EJB05_28377, partial [Eragrostis curvula]
FINSICIMYIYSNVCPAACWSNVRTTLVMRCSSTSDGPEKLPFRRSANYQPNIWNYGYIESLGTGIHGHNPINTSRFDKLKFHVRHLLTRDVEPSLRLRAIDMVQRLGVAYHFDEEISAVLKSVSADTPEVFNRLDNFNSRALLFRLRRQNHAPAPQVTNSIVAVPSCEAVHVVKLVLTIDSKKKYNSLRKIAAELLRDLQDGMGGFKKTLLKDIEGLCSLYEASHLAFEGETFLDEAREFSAGALNELMPSMPPHLRSFVAHALDNPLHWTAPRLHTRWFIDHYARDIGADPLMLQFAKVDFNNVQSLYQQELSKITCWWRDANLREKLPFARDRLMECFYFACGVVCEPSFGACREVVAKIFSLVVLLDDIYDIYGTLDELTILTNAIERWEETAIILFFAEPDKQILCQWHDLCKAFLLEAKWHYNNYNPTLQEYLDNGWVCVSGPLMLLHAFPMLKMDINPNSLQQLESYPKLVRLVSKVFRLCNDSATHSEELKRGDAPSSIAIHMFENRSTEHESRMAMKELTMEIWKMVNQDAYDNCPYHLYFAKACVNMARISHCIYKGVDGISAPDDKKRMEIEELFLEPQELKFADPLYAHVLKSLACASSSIFNSCAGSMSIGESRSGNPTPLVS